MSPSPTWTLRGGSCGKRFEVGPGKVTGGGRVEPGQTSVGSSSVTVPEPYHKTPHTPGEPSLGQKESERRRGRKGLDGNRDWGTRTGGKGQTLETGNHNLGRSTPRSRGLTGTGSGGPLKRGTRTERCVPVDGQGGSGYPSPTGPFGLSLSGVKVRGDENPSHRRPLTDLGSVSNLPLAPFGDRTLRGRDPSSEPRWWLKVTRNPV